MKKRERCRSSSMPVVHRTGRRRSQAQARKCYDWERYPRGENPMDAHDPLNAAIEALAREKPRCTATSKQTGERCKRRPHPGSTVCVMHGAGAPQVQRSARERLNALVEPAIAALGKVIKRLDGDPDAAGVVIRAAQIVLDRTGYHLSLIHI